MIGVRASPSPRCPAAVLPGRVPKTAAVLLASLLLAGLLVPSLAGATKKLSRCETCCCSGLKNIDRDNTDDSDVEKSDLDEVCTKRCGKKGCPSLSTLVSTSRLHVNTMFTHLSHTSDMCHTVTPAPSRMAQQQ